MLKQRDMPNCPTAKVRKGIKEAQRELRISQKLRKLRKLRKLTKISEAPNENYKITKTAKIRKGTEKA